MTNPIVSANAGSQPDTTLDIPNIKPPASPTVEDALQPPSMSPEDVSNANPFLEGLQTTTEPNPGVLDPNFQGVPQNPGSMQPVLDVPQSIPSIPMENNFFEQAQNESAQGFVEVDNLLAPRPLPEDMQLPQLFEGDLQQGNMFIDRFGQLSQQFTQQQARQQQQQQWSSEALKRLATMQDGQEKSNSFFNWLISDNKYNDFDPTKGRWGDYGGGALGAAMFTIGILGKSTQAAWGTLIDAGRFGQAFVDTTRTQGFNPNETGRILLGGVNPLASNALGALSNFIGSRGFNPFNAEWRNEFRKNLNRTAPDNTANILNPGRYSYALAPIFTPGRDISFSQWQQDLRGRNNPLGFLYGKQAENDGKLDWGKGLAALALDVFADPTQLLRRPLRRGARVLSELTPTRKALPSSQPVIGLLPPAKPRALPPTRSGVRVEQPAIPLVKNADGVFVSTPSPSASVRPVEVVKKYREYQKRLALPAAPDGVPGSIDAPFSVTSQIPSIQSVATALKNNPSVDILDEAANTFNKAGLGVEFPRGSIKLELDQYIDDLAKAKTPKGRAAAQQRFDKRIATLEKKWMEANAPKPTPDMSRFSWEPFKDSLLRGQAEAKLLPEVSSRLNGVLQESDNVLMVATPEGSFRRTTEDVKNAWRPTPLLKPFDESTVEYTVRPMLSNDDLIQARQTFVEANSSSRTIRMKAWIDETGNYDPVNLGEAKIDYPQPVRVYTKLEDGSNVVMPAVDLEAASKVLTIESPQLTSQRALKSLLDGSRVTLDGVTTMNAAEVAESVNRRGLLQPSLPNTTAVPVSLFKPQNQIQQMIEGSDFINPYSVEALTPRNIDDLNDVVSWLPSPDGYRLLDRRFDTYEGLVSALARRLIGQPRAVVENYLSTVRRLGEEVKNLKAGEIEVLLRRQGSDSTPAMSIISRQLEDVPRLPYADNSFGVPGVDDINKALDDGLDPNTLIDNLVEPNLNNPTIQANILKNTPDIYVGVTPQTKQMAIERVRQERILNELTDTRKEIEALKDASETKLEELLDDIEKMPDIGMKPLPGTALLDTKQLTAGVEPSLDLGVGVMPELTSRRLLPQLDKPLPDLKDIDPDGYKTSVKGIVDDMFKAWDDILEGFDSKLPKMSDMAKMSEDELSELWKTLDDQNFADDLKVVDEALEEGRQVSLEYKALFDELALDEDLMSDPEIASIIRSGRNRTTTVVNELSRLGRPSYFHGTRVSNLMLSMSDPLIGGSRGEFGTALYLTKNPVHAETHAMADVVPNLPYVQGREFGDGFVHEIRFKGSNVLQASTPLNDDLKKMALDALNLVSDGLDPIQTKLTRSLKASFSRSKDLTLGKLYDKITTLYDNIGKKLPSYAGVDETFILNWQRTFNELLRKSGVDAIEQGDVLAVLKPSALETLAVKPFGNDIESPLSVAVSRYNALAFAVRNNPDSVFLKVQKSEAQATMLTRLSDKLQTQLDDIDERTIRHLQEMMDFDEGLKNIVESERSRLKQVISETLQESDNKTLAPIKFKDTPCL